MNAELTSGDHFAEVNPGDPLYRDLQLRGYNRRYVGTPDSVFVVDDTDQVVKSRLYGQLSDHLYAVETVVVDENGKVKAVTATREEIKK
jgi:hypothetical protein